MSLISGNESCEQNENTILKTSWPSSQNLKPAFIFRT